MKTFKDLHDHSPANNTAVPVIVLVTILFLIALSGVVYLLISVNPSISRTPDTLVPQYTEPLPAPVLPEPALVPQVTLLAVGDMMLDRSVWLKTKQAGTYDHPFLLIDPLFTEYDIRLGNLEGPITTYPSVANGTGGARFTFTFSPEFVEPLAQRFTMLSLANNHTHNFGRDGLAQTRTLLTNAGLNYFGDPFNTPQFISTTTTVNGISFGFVGFHELIGTGFEEVIAETTRLNPTVDVLIAMPHWGTEYVTDTPTVHQRNEAYALIDAGADIVIGSHPHVVQPIEQYSDKLIFYSLGNFIFDQYFSEETMSGLTLGLTIEKQHDRITTTYTLLPIRINTLSQPYLADSSDSQKMIQQLTDVSQEIDQQPSMASGTLVTSWEILPFPAP